MANSKAITQNTDGMPSASAIAPPLSGPITLPSCTAPVVTP
nr:hypothetical protein [Anaerosporomusa subterranea]